MKKKIYFLLSLLSAIGCTHQAVQSPFYQVNTPNSPVPDIPCDPDSVYFVNQVLPILVSNCTMSGCHDPASHKDGVVLNNYTNVINTTEVVPFKPNKGDLYEALTETDPDKRMPPGGNLPADLINKIKTWIEQGALNNACNGCDSGGVITYAAKIQPILQNHCNGCHSGSAPGAGIDLSNYSGVKAIADNGRLQGVITHAVGYSPMPKNAAKLSDCQITSITKWINDGAQNN